MEALTEFQAMTQAGILGYLLAAGAYGILTLLLILSWRKRHLTGLLLLASATTALWALFAFTALAAALPLPLLQLSELARDLLWCLFLVRLLRGRAEQAGSTPRRWIRWQWGLGTAAGASALLLVGSLVDPEALPAYLLVDAPLVVWVGFSVAGLLLVEQLFRNAQGDERWALKHLSLGLGCLFAYDFYMYSEALLFRQIDSDLWRARGFVDTLAAPLIAISAARNESWTRGIHVSRQVVFHSLTLLVAGVYLLLMAFAGYFIRLYGGSWGGVMEVAFVAGALLLLLILLFSDTLRARLRVLLSKHFFSYKYDYREEWRRFTRTLASGDNPIPERVIRALAALVHSRGGLLWARTADGRYERVGQWALAPPDGTEILDASDPLLQFLESTGWVVDLDEYHATPSLYQGLALPKWLLGMDEAWLVTPLQFRDELLAFLVIRRPEVAHHINWEDRDLLKMAGQQAAAHLAQHLADQALMQARQFEAFNRLSAYIVHDLKNILAQQSLIVANAEKHKHNPAFVDDVINTVRNSVNRMTRLMEQMRSGLRGGRPVTFSLAGLLEKVVQRRSAQKPAPELTLPDEPLCVEADEEQLATVFGHLIQNAQEATKADGHVWVRLFRAGDRSIIEVEDTGVGMDAEFIRERLFKPFDSTKGLTGMGIGVFESREYIRALGGEIRVTSTPGKGSLFRIDLPLQPCETQESESHSTKGQPN